jgi:hypothetical protein
LAPVVCLIAAAPRRAVGDQGVIVMLPGSVVCVPALSVTATVKVNVPAVVGVPESPAGAVRSRVRPGSSCPAGIDQVYGWTPPLAKKFVW